MKLRIIAAVLLMLSIMSPDIITGQNAVIPAQSPARPAPSTQPEDNGPPNPDYLLGPKDQVTIWVREGENMNGSFGIDAGGFVNIPMIGRVMAAGLTVAQFELVLAEKMAKYLVDPQVTVNIVGMRAIPASVMGLVVSPGVKDIGSKKTLLELISMCGGLKAEASPTVRITRKIERGRLPLANAADDATGKFSVGEVNIKSAETNPSENIDILEDDLVTVGIAPLVYVTGDVEKQGALRAENGGISILKAILDAGGMTKTANPRKAKILRPILAGTRQTEFDIDIQAIKDGRAPDQMLRPDDVLFIPGSARKDIISRAMTMAVQLGTSMVTLGIFGVIR
jgi:polysaccharide biosynthesis/export protein